MFKSKNVLLSIALLFTLTACGGGDSTNTDSGVKERSIHKISDYASNPSVKPLKQDYLNAGIDTDDLSFVDIDELNTLVASKNSTEVDSEAELKALAHSIMDKTAPVITLNGKNLISIVLESNYIDAGATAIDNKDGKVSVKTTSDINTSRIGIYTVTYEASDKFNNRATRNRVIKVIAKSKPPVVVDSTPPVITIATPSTIKEGEEFSPIATTDDGSVVTYGGKAIDSSTPPGTYTITYNSQDSLGNKANEIQRDVTVKALTISELLTASSNGTRDVTYIAVGDSTRNYPGTNISFVNEYYPSLLNSINVKFKNSAASGQRAYEWLDGNSDGAWYAYSETKNMIPTNYEEQRNYILEFSMGINDAKEKNKSQFTKILRDSIQKLQRDRKYIKIVLVSPVPHDISSSLISSSELEEIYKDIAAELDLSFVSGKEILQNKYDDARVAYYEDPVHPNEEGSKILFNHIFKSIATLTIYNRVKL